MIKNVLLIVAAVLVVFFVIGVITGGPTSQASQASARDEKPAGSKAVEADRGPGDLHGLATIDLPKGWVSLGLAEVIGPRGEMSVPEQLARHADSRAAVFRLAKDRHNDIGGHARDPELLNVVLLNPVDRTSTPLKDFSIERYYSPTGSTIPLDDPRWQSAEDGRYRWLWLEMNDHFGTDEAPRWAIAMYDAEKHVRLDFFVWRKRYKFEQALTFLRTRLESIRIASALHAHFSQEGTYDERIAKLREANIAHFLQALAPLNVSPPANGAVTFGPSTAAWIDDDRQALRVLRLLARVPLSERTTRDQYGRPVISVQLERNQYPGATRNGLPSLYLGMLYWNDSTQRWHRSLLQYPTTDEQHPLLPFEETVSASLDRGSAYFVMSTHYYRPYALDDAREINEFLDAAAFWERELAAGRIVPSGVLPATFAGVRP